MDDDWDLQAVVRGCTTAPSSTTTTITTTTGGAVTSSVNVVNTGDFCTRSCFSSLSSESFSGSFFSTSDPFETRNTNFAGDLHELYKPFFTKSYQLSRSEPISPFVVCKEQTPLKHHHQQSKQSQTGSVTSSASSHTPRSKRRKNQLKKICQVPAEALSSDVWAWRKYGQKPIKGSPYPRGYYRCSSSKGCLARKQVERNKSDPGMFIVTYTGEHNHPAPTHRNSLAGSTRQKTSTSQAIAAGDSGQPSLVKPTCSSSPGTSVDDELLPVGTNTESREEKDVMEDGDEDEFVGFSDDVSDDFFEGLEELASPAAGDKFSDHFTSTLGLPWLATSAATAATGL